MTLEVNDLKAGYGGGDVLHGISLRVAAGSIVALVGANGAGKSTLARAMSGLLDARGSILLDGVEIGNVAPGARLLRGLAQVPEGRQVFAALSIADNLRLGAFAPRKRLGEAGIRARMDEVLQWFPPLASRLAALAGNLSGGQQQMLAIARALMSRPRVLVLDEPSLGLSPLFVREIFAILRTLRDAGVAVLLAEQNARAALALADHGIVIESGRVAMEGPDLLDRPEIVARYLGAGGAEAPSGEQTLRRTDMAAALAAALR